MQVPYMNRSVQQTDGCENLLMFTSSLLLGKELDQQCSKC